MHGGGEGGERLWQNEDTSLGMETVEENGSMIPEELIT